MSVFSNKNVTLENSWNVLVRVLATSAT